METCQYIGCSKPLDTRWQPKDEGGARLCREHADEINKAIDNNDIGSIVSFGVKVIKGQNQANG